MKKIEPTKYYSAKSIIDMGILPWASAVTFNKKLNDKRWQEIFKPLVEQHESIKRYKIKGKRILKFLDSLERGKIKLN